MKLVKIRSSINRIEIEFRSQSFTKTSSFDGWVLEASWRKEMVTKKFESVLKSKKEICVLHQLLRRTFLAKIIY